MLELRMARYLVAVAETEHVGRAARRLHISQSPLSRQIRQLEDQLGLQLFDRERRRMRLTEAGRWFAGQARALLDHAERVERDAARVARGESGGLTVGFVRSALWSGLLAAALGRFRRSRPGVHVELRNLPSSAQVKAIRRGEIDLALVHEAPRLPHLVAATLATERYLLALPLRHPLARKKRLGPSDLDGEAWIALSRALQAAAHDRFIAACARAGFLPEVVAEASDHATMLGLVDAGVGAALVPVGTRSAAPRGIVFRELRWLPMRLPLELLRRGTGASPAALDLGALLVACARRR